MLWSPFYIHYRIEMRGSCTIYETHESKMKGGLSHELRQGGQVMFNNVYIVSQIR